MSHTILLDRSEQGVLCTSPIDMPAFTFQTRLPLPETGQELQDRLKSLFMIQDELAREIETLIGKKVDFEPGRPWHCLRCDHQWLSRLPHRPRLCPACKTKKFDSRPAFTYEERLARKAKQPVTAAATVPVPAPVVQSAPLPHSVLTRPADPVALTPPPAAPSTGMSLRERLALVASRSPEQIVQHVPPPPEHVSVMSDDDLIEAINHDDAT